MLLGKARRKPMLKRKFQPLRRASRWPVWADVSARLGLAVGLMAVVVLIHWIGRDGLRDQLDGEISLTDVIYFTAISVSTTGFGDIVPVTDSARLIEALLITPIRIIVIFIFVGTAYNFVIKRSWEKWRMARIQEQLTGHIVVLGFGTSGSEAVRELVARGTAPASIVVVDPSAERLDAAEKLGCNVLAGDASRDQTLIDVRVGTAASVLVSAGRDDSSILIVLSVRHLAPTVPITVVVRATDNELLARQAGADTVINPVSFTGLLLAGSANGAHVAEYLADLASITGRVQLNERPVRADEIGGSIDNLATTGRGLRVYRGGKPYGFWQAEAQALAAGDIIVEVVRCADCDAE